MAEKIEDLRVSSSFDLEKIFKMIAENELEVVGQGYNNQNTLGIMIHPKGSPNQVIEIYLQK